MNSTNMKPSKQISKPFCGYLLTNISLIDSFFLENRWSCILFAAECCRVLLGGIKKEANLMGKTAELFKALVKWVMTNDDILICPSCWALTHLSPSDTELVHDYLGRLLNFTIFLCLTGGIFILSSKWYEGG